MKFIPKPTQSLSDSTIAETKITFKVRDSFSSFEEFKQRLDKYCKQENQYFVIRDNIKCKSKCTIKTCKLKEGLVYHDLLLECKHGPRRHKSIQKINEKRSLKVNCPARIQLHASKNGKFLVITKIGLEHIGHLDTEIDPIPEVRRLDPDEKAEVLKLIKLSCGRSQLLEYISRTYRKQLYSYDIKNLMASLREKDSDDLKTTIEFLQTKGARIDILKEANVFQGMFFTTPDMIASLKAWPEVVSFDGTYKLMMHGLILILFFIQDGNLLTEDVGVAIVRREDQASYDWVFDCFNKHHEEAAANIKYFMCDKNATQRNSVIKHFPNASLLVCWWHTLEIFKREIQKLKIDVMQKEICLDLLMKFRHVDTLEEYDELLYEIKKNFPEQALRYFIKNWDPIKTQWTCFTQNGGTLGCTTNNRCESINQKLKVQIKLLSKLPTAVQGFFTWKNFHQNENNKKIVKNFGSEIPSCNSKYQTILLDKTLRLVRKECITSEHLVFDSESNGTFSIRRSRRITTADACNCYFNRSYLLPCKHIFFVRRKLELPLYDPRLCHERWTKDFIKVNHRVFMTNLTLPTKQDPTIREKQYNVGELDYQKMKLCEVCSDLTDMVSLMCGDNFKEQFCVLSTVKKFWSDKKLFKVETKQPSNVSEYEKTIIVAHELENLSLIRNVEQMDVPQKRRKVAKLFENIYTELDKTKEIKNKVELLSLLRKAWLESQKVYICHVDEQQVTNLDVEATQLDDRELVLPPAGKMKGRPKNALVTTKNYKRK